MKMDTKMECPKCGHKPTYSNGWNLEYKDQCYVNSKCGWNDNVIKEHLHQSCPECSYTIAVETADYDVLTGNVWNANTDTPQTITTAPVSVGKNPVKPDIAPLIAACNANRASTGGVPQPATAKPTVTPTKPVAAVTPIRQNTQPNPIVHGKCRSCPVEADCTPKV